MSCKAADVQLSQLFHEAPDAAQNRASRLVELGGIKKCVRMLCEGEKSRQPVARGRTNICVGDGSPGRLLVP